MNPRVLPLTSIGLFIQSNVFNHLSNTALPFQSYEIRTSKKTSVLLSLESRIQLSLLEKYHCNSNVQKGNKNDEDLILAQSALKA